jgi:ABC-type sugar transport system ATPase subunit
MAFARALVLNPAVLLLDERLTGLDERLRQQLCDEIGRLPRRLGATIVGPATGQIRVAHPNERPSRTCHGHLHCVTERSGKLGDFPA